MGYLAEPIIAKLFSLLSPLGGDRMPLATGLSDRDVEEREEVVVLLLLLEFSTLMLFNTERIH